MKQNTGCILQLPRNKEIVETATNYIWLDEDGILYSLAKGHEPTVEDVKENLATFKRLLGNKKTCLITDTSKTKYYTIEKRNMMTRALPKLFCAVAIVPCTSIGKVMGNILFKRGKNFPVKVFDNLEEAKLWAKQYCDPSGKCDG